MKRVRQYIIEIFEIVFDSPKKALLPNGDLKTFLGAYKQAYLTTWVLRGFIGGFLGFSLDRVLSNPYFTKAAKQAISPELWNIIISFGLICALAGVIAQLARINWLEWHAFNSARALLAFGSEAGAIAYGVLFAMLPFALFQSGLGDLWTYLYTSIGLSMMVFVAGLNLLVFWVLYCLQDVETQPKLFQNLKSHPIFCAVLCSLLILMLLILTAITKPNQRETRGNEGHSVDSTYKCTKGN